MVFTPLFEPAKRIVIRSRLVAVMRDLAKKFGCSIGEVREIAGREFTVHELEHTSEPPR